MGGWHDEDHWMELYSGRRFRPLSEGNPGEFSVIDIAHALSLKCRYNGHVSAFYSVAQHCCLLHDFVGAGGGDAVQMARILMHDATEAYLPDVPRPLKPLMHVFRDAEENLEHWIMAWLGLQHALPPWMKELDSRITRDERSQLMGPSVNIWDTDGLEPLDVQIEPWPPERAEEEFLLRFAVSMCEVKGRPVYWKAPWRKRFPDSRFRATDNAGGEVRDVFEADSLGGLARVITGVGEQVLIWEWREGEINLERTA